MTEFLSLSWSLLTTVTECFCFCLDLSQHKVALSNVGVLSSCLQFKRKMHLPGYYSKDSSRLMVNEGCIFFLTFLYNVVKASPSKKRPLDPADVRVMGFLGSSIQTGEQSVPRL